MRWQLFLILILGATAAVSAPVQQKSHVQAAQLQMSSGKPGALRGAAGCGNSVLDTGETCDDGNAIGGDGCSASCQVEEGYSCTAPVPGEVINGVPDGGFELGTPSPVWDEGSTNFPSPLCDSGCGSGGGTGPFSGNWWAWFGGVAAAEQGFVEQTLVIEPGDTVLSFQIEQPVCDSAADYARMLIDGNIVFTTDGSDPSCGLIGYRQIEIDLATAPGGPYNDGGPHILRIESEIFALTLGESNFFFDDLVMFRGVGPPTPSVCTLDLPTCYFETFDAVRGAGLAGWTVFNDGPLALDWGTTDDGFCGFPGNYTGGDGVAACVDSDAAGKGVVNSYLCSPPIELADVTGATLEFLYNYQVFSSSPEDAFEVLVGTAPPDVATVPGYTQVFLTTDDRGGFAGAGADESLDISSFDGNTVHVCYRYSGDFDWYAQVDNVAIVANSCTPDGDGDGIADVDDNCPAVANESQADTDNDGHGDACDNCILLANEGQQDTNGDGIGNRCDADIAVNQGGGNDCIVNLIDLLAFRAAFLASPGVPAWNPDADLNSDLTANLLDLLIFRSFFLQQPGPAASPNELSGCVP